LGIAPLGIGRALAPEAPNLFLNSRDSAGEIFLPIFIIVLFSFLNVINPSPFPTIKDETGISPAILLALIFDWAAAIFVVQLLPNAPAYATQSNAIWTLVIFASQITLLTWLIGASFGQKIVGLKVVDNDLNQNPNFVKSLIRTVLIVLVIPPLLADAEGRGLHDRLAKTKIINV